MQCSTGTICAYAPTAASRAASGAGDDAWGRARLLNEGLAASVRFGGTSFLFGHAAGGTVELSRTRRRCSPGPGRTYPDRLTKQSWNEVQPAGAGRRRRWACTRRTDVLPEPDQVAHHLLHLHAGVAGSRRRTRTPSSAACLRRSRCWPLLYRLAQFNKLKNYLCFYKYSLQMPNMYISLGDLAESC